MGNDSNAHYQAYINDAVVYNSPQPIEANCAQITFYNLAPTVGGATMTILGIPLTPGQGLSFKGNDGELDITKYYLTFGAGVQACLVIRKNYRNPQ